jgi:hypothetical protein
MKESGIVYSHDSDFFPLITKRLKRVALYTAVWLFGASAVLAIPITILMLIGK